ncbi:MAG: PASTA domain-containing protein [Clostridia bacterium]|nr:PASTA domain-containing protein [Clostridia bacterium]
MTERASQMKAFVRTRRRASLLLFVFSLIAAYLLTTIFRMQVLDFLRYRKMVNEQITTSSPLVAERGTILDASGNVLAESKTVWRVYLSPVDIKSIGKRDGVDYVAVIADGLSRILDLPYETVEAKAKKSNTNDQTVKKNVDAESYLKVLSFISEHGLSAMVHCEASVTRSYPNGTLAAHVLGFTGSDLQGLFGLEYQYDEILRGENGSYLHAKDATGRELEGVYLSYVAPTKGSTIQTTLDLYVQKQLEYTVAQISETFDVKNRVCGIVMEVKTGAILGMATSEPFDPNDPYTLDRISEEKLIASGLEKGSAEYAALRSELLYAMWRNKATSELYEPGSTFKILTSAMALDLGVVSKDERFSCTGGLQIGGYNISCHKRGGHGSGFTFAYGLQQSCNPTLMQIGARIGAERFYDYFDAFGFFEKTGIDLPSEVTAIFHKKNAIGTTELATSSFGQRFKVSILAQLTAVAAVANGGKLVTPYLVRRVLDESGNVISEHETVIRREVVGEEAAKAVSAILEEGVSGDGGARNAYVDGYLVAAKTGTSQKFDILDENGNSYLRIGSCVAYAPSDDAEIALILVVDEPTTAKYGATVAAPYVSSLLSSLLPYLEVKESGERRSESVTVSDYRGLSVGSAKNALRSSKLDLLVIGDGTTVVSQFPSPGTTIDLSIGRIILYTDGATSKTVSVPSLIGMTAREANEALLAAGLNVSILGTRYARGNEIPTVTSQNIPPGTVLPIGSVVQICVIYPNDTD